jgi:cytochrome oxidase maturation protein, cbb3-type
VSSAYLLIPLGLVLMAAATAVLFWAVNSGQFDDLEEAGRSILESDDAPSGEPDAAPDRDQNSAPCP